MSHPNHLIRYIATGSWGHVQWGITKNLEAEAEIFYNSLPDELGRSRTPGSGRGEKAQAKFLWLCQQLANDGTIPKLNRFSKEEPTGVIHGIKFEVGKLIRFACFQEGNCWVVTHGFFKPGAQKGKGLWPQVQIDRAFRIMNEHKDLFGKD